MADISPAAGHRIPLPSWRQVIVTAVIIAVVAGFAAAILVHKANERGSAPQAQSRNEFMNLESLQGHPAPNIALTDQSGKALALSGLQHQGRVVVLEFMDPQCTDICPIISQEFKVAYKALGADAGRVAFVAVNVNPFHTTMADVASFTNEQGLEQVPSWHFVTGTVPQLQQAWHDYGIAVQAPSPTADVVHSDNMYFIDASGRERWVASPTDDHTANGTAYLPAGQVRQWGLDIASVARQMVG
ncbi:MAG: SCO family protein [Acidimicrobiales bacterium]